MVVAGNGFTKIDTRYGMLEYSMQGVGNAISHVQIFLLRIEHRISRDIEPQVSSIQRHTMFPAQWKASDICLGTGKIQIC